MSILSGWKAQPINCVVFVHHHMIEHVNTCPFINMIRHLIMCLIITAFGMPSLPSLRQMVCGPWISLPPIVRSDGSYSTFPSRRRTITNIICIIDVSLCSRNDKLVTQVDVTISSSLSH